MLRGHGPIIYPVPLLTSRSHPDTLHTHSENSGCFIKLSGNLANLNGNSMTDQTVPTTPPAPILVNFDKKLDYKEAKFGFRQITDKETGVVTKRATVELTKLPVPSVEGIVAILETGGKALELLQEAVLNVILDRARDVVNDSDSITSENFDYNLIDWNTIANLEKEDRRSGISKETWEDFSKDYVEVMPAISSTSKEQCANAAKIFVGKFAAIKSKKDVIEKLKMRLSLYAEHSPKANDFVDCVDFLFKKADKLISAKEESLEDNLGL